MSTCSACGNANPDGARFCNACAARLGSAVTTGAREERKVVSVLFADLAGFTARSEALDPEDVRAFLLPYYDVLSSEITRHGGLVDRFLGDGVMAIFGAPIAHEDDPERAVRAAFRILERIPALGLDLHVRLGVNTGPVLFVAGSGNERDDAITGDAVNTAARLQALAPTDGVVVGESTYRATSHLFLYEALAPTLVKGKTEPVGVFRPTAPLARRAGELGPEATSFVGRDVEFSILVGLFERSRTTPSVEFATIIAEPGMGKSRLVRELARHVDALPDLVTWRVGRCLPYGDGISLWALSEIVKGHAGILDTDDQPTLRAKLDAVLTEPDPSLRSWIADRLAPLVGLVTATGPPQQEEAFTAWRRFLESMARARPTVLVVEDLHWADRTMVAFLAHLADHAAGLPLLLVTTARPELEERHPAWLSRTRRSTVLSLAALPDRAMTSLVAGSLPDASPEMLATVLERAAGSPLYAEQLAAMVRERPLAIVPGSLDDDAIPASIAALLAARIDALPPEAKAVLLDASVVGKTFWSGAVAALSERERALVEPHLAMLARRELIRPVFPSSMAGEIEYTFWHALLRDVAYGELTRAARLARHRTAAAWLTERAGASFGEDAEIVVAHLDRALELAKAIGAVDPVPGLQDALANALLAAGKHALRTEVQRAKSQLRRALDLLKPDDPRRPDALAAFGTALHVAGDQREAAGMLHAATEAYRAAGDPRAAAALAVSLSSALGTSGEAERGRTVLAEARAALERDPGPELVEVLAAEVVVRWASERAGLADLVDETLRLAISFGLPPPPRALMVRGLLRFADDERAGEQDYRDAIDGAIEAGDLWAADIAFSNLVWSKASVLGPLAGLAVLDEALAFEASHGLRQEAARAGRAALLFDVGRWDECLADAEGVLVWARARGDAWTIAEAGATLALVRLERGEPVDARDELEAAIRGIGRSAATWAPAAPEAALAAGDAEAARRLLIEGLEVTAPGELIYPARLVRACLRAGAPDLARRAFALGEAAHMTAELLIAQAMLAEAGDDLAAARAGYEGAGARFEERDEPPEHAYALAGVGRCLLGLGETEEGVARLRESREIWRRLRATPRIAEIDTLLETAGSRAGAAGIRRSTRIAPAGE